MHLMLQLWQNGKMCCERLTKGNQSYGSNIFFICTCTVRTMAT